MTIGWGDRTTLRVDALTCDTRCERRVSTSAGPLLRLSRRHHHSVKRVIKGERDRRRRRKGRRRRRLDCRAAAVAAAVAAAAARRCGDRFADTERTSDAVHCWSRRRFPLSVTGCGCICGSQHVCALDNREDGPRDGRTQDGLIPFFPDREDGLAWVEPDLPLDRTACPLRTQCRDRDRFPPSPRRVSV
jgi:hypothetical protein